MKVVNYFIPEKVRRWVGDNVVWIGGVVLAALIAVGFVAMVVEASTPVSGTVVEKIHTPDRSGYVYGYSCQSGKCENGNYYNYAPEKWTLVIKDCTETCKYKSRDVDENTYYKHKVGDHYSS